MYFTAMNNRHLVIVRSPDCFQHSASTFVFNEFLLTGWLKGVAATWPRITLTTKVTAEVAGQLADALERIDAPPQEQLHDALCGDPGGGLDAFCAFLRGGGFRLVNGEQTKPDDVQ